jgi:hypothetical protein
VRRVACHSTTTTYRINIFQDKVRGSLCRSMLLLRVTKTWFYLHLSGNWSPIYTPIVSKLARKNLPYMEEFFLTRNFHENSSLYHQWIILSDIACPRPYTIAYEAVLPTDHASTVRTNICHKCSTGNESVRICTPSMYAPWIRESSAIRHVG